MCVSLTGCRTSVGCRSYINIYGTHTRAHTHIALLTLLSCHVCADYWGQCQRISYMVIGVLNRIDTIKERYGHLTGPDFQAGGGGRDALDSLWEVAFRMLRGDNPTLP